MASEDDQNAAIQWGRIADVVHEPLRIMAPIEGFETAPLVPLEDAVKRLAELKLVHDIEKKVSEAKQKCGNSVKDGLSIDESASIRLYTMVWKPHDKCLYFALNKTLRDEDRDKLKPWFWYLRLLIGSLVKLRPNVHAVFRGVRLDIARNYKNEEKFTWWAFSSSTEFLHVLQKSTFLGKTGERTLFYIDGYSAVDIRNHSDYISESELVFLPGTEFKTVSCLDVGNELKIVHIKEIEGQYSVRDKISEDPVIPPTTDSIQNSGPKSVRPIKRDDGTRPNSNLESRISAYPRRSAIDLSKQNVTDEDVPTVIRKAMEEKQCTKLDLRKNEITWFGISILAEAIRGNTTLEELNLSQNSLKDADLYQLAKALLVNDAMYVPEFQFCGMARFKTLDKVPIRVLDLGENDIADEGVKYLAEVIRSKPTLTTLCLNGNRIGNEGSASLANALCQQGTNLQRLDLHNNRRINDDIVNILVNMFEENQSLTTFWLTNCSISDQGKQTLQDRTPPNKNFYF